jgi:hypothetical protein
MSIPLQGQLGEPPEHLSPDDWATRREAEFLEAALRARSLAAKAQASTPGTCANCGATCLPQAVYCDTECRADHEQRRLVMARQGRAE